jgi:hypothetical protein
MKYLSMLFFLIIGFAANLFSQEFGITFQPKAFWSFSENIERYDFVVNSFTTYEASYKYKDLLGSLNLKVGNEHIKDGWEILGMLGFKNFLLRVSGGELSGMVGDAYGEVEKEKFTNYYLRTDLLYKYLIFYGGITNNNYSLPKGFTDDKGNTFFDEINVNNYGLTIGMDNYLDSLFFENYILRPWINIDFLLYIGKSNLNETKSYASSSGIGIGWQYNVTLGVSCKIWKFHAGIGYNIMADIFLNDLAPPIITRSGFVVKIGMKL